MNFEQSNIENQDSNNEKEIDEKKKHLGDLDIVEPSLEKELKAMQERDPERNDTKYTVLKRFVEELEKGKSFYEAYNNLSDCHKHCIITRLQNQAEHILGPDDVLGEIPLSFITKLENDLYGDRQERSYDEKTYELEDELLKDEKEAMMKKSMIWKRNY